MPGVGAVQVMSAPRAASTWSGVRPWPVRRVTIVGIISSRWRRSATERRMAAAGLFSSCASPAESLPSDIIFSRWTSVRDDSRTRSVIRATSRLPTSGIRASISVKWSLWTCAIRLSAMAMPSPANVSMRE